GTLIRKASRDEDAWPSGAGIAWALFLIAAVSFAFLAVGSTSDTANHPRPADALLLLLLIPLTIAMRDELRVHFDPGGRRKNAIYVIRPLLLAPVLTLVPHGVPVPRTKLRLARPILSSVSIVTACGALASVAVLGDSKAIGSLQSTLLIVLLGGGIAARVVANQVASTQAHQAVEEALTRRETALREADLALERVRETNETIRRSEEHLRLVFDAAVDR